MVGGGLSACVGADVFGSARASRKVFDPTVVRWWDEGGWKSFAVVVFIGAVAIVAGLWLAFMQLHRDDGRFRTPNIIFAPHGSERGETSLRASALSHGLEADLTRIPDVEGAMVALFGRYPDIELRAVLDIGDRTDLDHLPDRVEEVLDRLVNTTGIRPNPIVVTVRFKPVDRERQLV